MKVIDPGHHYAVTVYDSETPITAEIRFMKRCGKGYPGNEEPAYAGTNCQELLRVLIDRVQYLNNQIAHEQNAVIIASLRQALLAFEVRAAERHGDTYTFVGIETVSTCPKCGHIACKHMQED